ncbi:glycosyltransferase [Clostridium chromiireducens]|uniref:Glycosyltransferase n=1 Tax=Clostridium chromiireducens TaxID=225345 RepID=A0A964RIJ8_9CLOT|nr:glycosyltransferase family 2 protein [Clostridium chromiireducens]MVX62329.1 glycosyltransferase [Clostridium chromiireducens]
MLSLCMIVKNEEENLKNCLSKVVAFIDEIIIVDTGSNDNTKNIAKKFTNKIYDFKWCNDFSKARNFSIKKASNDWVFVLDADELIIDFLMGNVEKFIRKPSNENKVGRIQRTNIIEDETGDKKYIERVNRLFNRNYFHYEGTIHEQIISKDNKMYTTDNIDISVEHIGYTREAISRTDKLNRNIDLLKEAVKKDFNDPYYYFQLGKSYYMLRDYIASASYFKKALEFELNFDLEYVEDLIETYGYSLINSERYSEALMLEKCIGIYSKYPDFNFLMGLIYMNNAKFTQAVESFLKCTKFSSSKVEGITTYSSYYNIGVIYDVLGFRKEAIKYYRMCGDYELAKNRLRSNLN